MIKTALNFNWQFTEGFKESYLKQSFTGESVDIPHTVKHIPKNYFDENITKMISTYQKTFSYDLKTNRRLFLRFEGVMSKAVVYLNEQPITKHIGGYTPFSVEITNTLKADNRLTVVVDSQETPDHPPFGHVVDYLTYGGIYREVTLIETGPDMIEHLLIDGDEHTLNLRAQLNTTTNLSSCVFKIFDGEQVMQTYHASITDQSVFLTEKHTLNVWSLTHPKLYTIKAYINQECIYSDRFGLRTIRVDENGFYLNGENIFLRGLNRHQSYPYVGYALPASAQRKDADMLKDDLGLNIVRSSHYPPSKHFLNRCDEIGLLVFTELPGWQHIGDETWQSHALNDLKTMVINDYNHPSIVIIGTRINESDDHDIFYQKTQDLVKSIDTSRPTGGVRVFAKSNLLEDIYTMNDFTHHGDNEGLTNKRNITKKRHPYLVTEYNGHMFPTKAFDNEERRIDHALRHFKVLDDAYKMNGLMGAIGWCMNDYHTHQAFGSNDHVCYHGVFDMNRNTKYAASVYASQGDKPYLNVLSNMHIGDRSSGVLNHVVVATNCDKVELYKNDQLIGTHFPSSTYSHLPHPPVIIKDFIGNQIEINEPFSKKDAKRIKTIMLYMMNNHLNMRLRDKITFAYILKKYKMSYADAVNLYTKYVGGWGEVSTIYQFKGYQNNQVVVDVNKGPCDDYHLNISADENTLYHKDTYDVTRITASLINRFNDRAHYAHAVITIEVSGDIKLIGPSSRALQGGIESFWIRSIKKGHGKVTVHSPQFESVSIDMTIST